MIDWQDLFAAIALYLILEGIIPFFSPRTFRQFLYSMQRISDITLRIAGICAIVAGVVLLNIVR